MKNIHHRGPGKPARERTGRSIRAAANSTGLCNYCSIDRFVILFFMCANGVMTAANVLLMNYIYKFF